MSLDIDSMVLVNSGLENLNSPILSKICAWGVMLGLFALSLIATAYACYIISKTLRIHALKSKRNKERGIG
ncbi:hypothetical protein ARALYDRAFT_916441 [Arabidopsis lyrata subsp. lyrata]|uniref:Uncharacterized protein n=1 Tax=Arabidopsis lyrata subsp. lyrata TaxID=81972 RepID=D7MJU9_ARALL|nr:hypothetical protein ARALYDRAFT_916441 [Arabidopsis lyrata subsp. lyrata]